MEVKNLLNDVIIVSCDLKMFHTLNSYIQEQTNNFCNLTRNKNI